MHDGIEPHFPTSVVIQTTRVRSPLQRLHIRVPIIQRRLHSRRRSRPVRPRRNHSSGRLLSTVPFITAGAKHLPRIIQFSPAPRWKVVNYHRRRRRTVLLLLLITDFSLVRNRIDLERRPPSREGIGKPGKRTGQDGSRPNQEDTPTGSCQASEDIGRLR